MSNKINIKTQEATDVKQCSVIDFSTLETKERKDDYETWNAMQLYGNSDAEERKYEISDGISQKKLREILKKAKSTKVGHKVFTMIADAA